MYQFSWLTFLGVRLELVTILKADLILFVVMCNTVCTVYIKKCKKNGKKGINLYCRFIFIANIVDSVRSFSTVKYVPFSSCWYFFNSNVAFVLRQNFHCYFQKDFLLRKQKLKHIYIFFIFLFCISLECFLQPLITVVPQRYFQIWSMSLILFCIFTWNKLILLC